MGTIENVQNELIPLVLQFSILVGLGVMIVGLIITVYGILKHKFASLKDALHYYFMTVGMGLMVSVSGTLISTMANMDVNTSVYKKALPPSVVTALILLAFCFLMTKPKNEDSNDKE